MLVRDFAVLIPHERFSLLFDLGQGRRGEIKVLLPQSLAPDDGSVTSVNFFILFTFAIVNA